MRRNYESQISGIRSECRQILDKKTQEVEALAQANKRLTENLQALSCESKTIHEENKILKKAVAIQENRYPIHYLADLLSLYFKLQNSFLYMQAPRHGQPEQQPAVRSWSGGGKDSLAARNE